MDYWNERDPREVEIERYKERKWLEETRQYIQGLEETTRRQDGRIKELEKQCEDLKIERVRLDAKVEALTYTIERMGRAV